MVGQAGGVAYLFGGRTANALKAKGVEPGVPDLLILEAGADGTHGLAVELNIDDNELDRVRGVVRDALELVVALPHDKALEDVVRLQQVREGDAHDAEAPDESCTLGKHGAQEWVAVGQHGRVRDPAVIVGLAAVRDVAQQRHAGRADLLGPAREHVREHLGAQVIVARSLLMRRPQLEQRLQAEHRPGLRHLQSEAPPHHPVHPCPADVCLEPSTSACKSVMCSMCCWRAFV